MLTPIALALRSYHAPHFSFQAAPTGLSDMAMPRDYLVPCTSE
jgi:hypothetical protein